MNGVAVRTGWLSACVLVLWLAAPALGMDHLVIERDGRTLRLDGRKTLEALDGSLMFQTRDGVMWLVGADEIEQLTVDEEPFEPYTAKELATRLLAELPPGFVVDYTANYVICYNTSRGYSQWCGALFERLHLAFTNYWDRKGFAIQEPEFPLVAVVFADKQSYARFARAELEGAVDSVVAYYSMRSNRITLYDLSGIEAGGGPKSRMNTAAQINQILRQPGAAPMVATIVHEATHQIAFNCGLHQRYSDCPRWFSEGIATYFETPDLSSSRGWRGIGQVNQLRLNQLRAYSRHRRADSLPLLLTDDLRLRNAETAIDAYAEAWGLTYFLLNQKPKEYVEYLETLSAKKPQFWDDAETRLDDFRAAFGQDLGKLDQEFLRFMSKQR